MHPYADPYPDTNPDPYPDPNPHRYSDPYPDPFPDPYPFVITMLSGCFAGVILTVAICLQRSWAKGPTYFPTYPREVRGTLGPPRPSAISGATFWFGGSIGPRHVTH